MLEAALLFSYEHPSHQLRLLRSKHGDKRCRVLLVTGRSYCVWRSPDGRQPGACGAERLGNTQHLHRSDSARDGSGQRWQLLSGIECLCWRRDYRPSHFRLQSDQLALKSSSPPANNPAQQPNLNPGNGLYHEASYTGSNLKVMIEVANDGTNTINPTGLSATTNSNNVAQQGISKPARQAKQLVELTTITVSVHRVKSPAVACGYINAKGWARGRRTIAGTLVMTKFTTDVLYSFLNSGAFTSDLSKDTTYMKVDQLPPFNLTLLFADEYGNSSSQRLLVSSSLRRATSTPSRIC